MKLLFPILALGASILLPETAGAQKPFMAHPPNAAVEKSDRLGSDWANPFEDLPGDGSVLTGFVAYCVTHENHRELTGLEPIYLGPKGHVIGNRRGSASADIVTVDAKPGYAVSGLGAKGGGIMDGFQIFFMRILPDAAGLDPADFYVSDWIGGQGETGRDIKYAGNNGRLVLGFHGRAGDEFAALGLIQAAPASLDPPPMQSIAADDASAYENAREAAPAKGTGFGPWIFASSDPSRAAAGFGVGSATSNGRQAPSGGIDSDGKSWMMHAAPGQAVTAVRTFSGGPLRPGQQFCLKMDNGEVEKDGTVGFILQSAAGADLLEFYFLGGSKNYRLRCNNADLDTGIPSTADGIHVVMTLFAGNHVLFDVRTGSGHFATLPGVLTGGDISQVKLYCRKAGADPANAVFWNGLAIRQPLPAKAAVR